MSIHGNADKGYMLEVDLEYSEVLHDLHSDYPLAPETNYVPDDIVEHIFITKPLEHASQLQNIGLQT
jgi:hypothetical protein